MAGLSGLPLFHRIAGRKVVVIGDGDAADAKRRLVERAGGIPVGEAEAHYASLAFVALEDRMAAEAAAIRLRCRGLLVNVVDRPEACDFTTPAVIERGPVTIAIGTGGASAGLAKHLRLRLEALLPACIGGLAEALSALRGELRERFPDPAMRRRAIDNALGEGAALDPFQEHTLDEIRAGLLEAAFETPDLIECKIFSDDPEDLTLRVARLLGRADTIAFEPGIAPAIIDRGRADAVRVPIETGSVLTKCAGGLMLVLRKV